MQPKSISQGVLQVQLRERDTSHSVPVFADSCADEGGGAIEQLPSVRVDGLTIGETPKECYFVKRELIHFFMRFGIIGSGWISDTFIDAAKHDTRVTFTAVYSRRKETGEAFAAKHGIKNVFTDIEEMCRSKEVDAVYIASPNTCHCEQAIACMRNGVNVLVEKPLAANAKQAQKMIDVARETGVLMMEALRLTPSPVFKAIRDNIGKIGEVHKYVSLFCQYSSKLERFNKGENFSSFSAETAGGSLMDLGVYCVYPMVALFGKPKSVKAVGTLARTGVDIEASVVCGYEDGKSASLVVSKACNSTGCSEIQGEKGTILIDKMSTMKSARIVYKDQTVEQLCTSEFDNDMVYEVREFCDLAERHQTQSEINSWQNSLSTMEVLDAARVELGMSIDFK